MARVTQPRLAQHTNTPNTHTLSPLTRAWFMVGIFAELSLEVGYIVTTMVILHVLIPTYLWYKKSNVISNLVYMFTQVLELRLQATPTSYGCCLKLVLHSRQILTLWQQTNQYCQSCYLFCIPGSTLARFLEMNRQNSGN